MPYRYKISKTIGYMVGDIINRNIELDVAAPYKLAMGSLPVKGVSIKGVELRDIILTEKKSPEGTHYRLQLYYQIFASGKNARKFVLPAENLRITKAEQSLKVTIPAWKYRVSPIAAFGEVYIEQDMSPYRGPMLVDSGYLKPLLAVFLGLVVISIAGLIYINADPAWFPGMGGPFSSSYRLVSNLTESLESNRRAVLSIHQAFNKTYGQNLFEADVQEFLQQHPGFSKIRHEVEAYFNLSNEVLFGANPDRQIAASLPVLVKFCEACRNCERGVA